MFVRQQFIKMAILRHLCGRVGNNKEKNDVESYTDIVLF